MNLDRSTLRAFALVSQIGCSTAISLIGSVVAGILLDKVLDTSPLFLIIGVFVGILLAGYSIFRLLPASTSRKAKNDEANNDQKEDGSDEGKDDRN